jgi:serine/threonine protein kinase
MLAEGTILQGRYLIKRILGSGGFADSYLAEDTHLPSRHKCVVKRLHNRFSDDQYDLVRDRFKQEALILERLEHDQIPKLYAFFEEENAFYLVQEYVPGPTLQEILHGIKFNADSVRKLLYELLPVVGYVHEQRIIHRDIKPSNIIIRATDGKPVLIDFGIMKEILDSQQGSTSIVAGTPLFMPPEQFMGHPLLASDIYAVGVMVIVLLTGGKFPDIDPQAGQLSWKPMVGDHFDEELATVIDKATALSLKERYKNAGEMLVALMATKLTSLVACDRAHPNKSPDYTIHTALPVSGFMPEFRTKLESPDDSTQISPSVEANKHLTDPPTIIGSANQENLLLKNFHSIETVLDSSDDARQLAAPFRVPGSAQPKEDSEPHTKARQDSSPSEHTELSPHITRVVQRKDPSLREELFHRADYEHLAGCLRHLQGHRYLLTGYGPFGGTSLVKMALKRTQQEFAKLAQNQQGAMIALHCEVDETKANGPFHMTMFGLGCVGDQSALRSNIGWTHLKEHADLNENLDALSVLGWKIPVKTLNVSTLQNSRRGRSTTGYKLAHLFQDIDQLQENPNRANLQKILKSLVNSDTFPLRIVLILDRVRKLETLERLKDFGFLADTRIHALAVARREDFDAWDDRAETLKRLQSVGFREWPVPSIEDHEMRNLILKAVKFSSDLGEDARTLIVNSFMYKGRGVVGNILEALADPQNALHSENGVTINTEKLKNDPKTKCHAWLQAVLEKNWSGILGDDFGGQDEHVKCDRARHGVYRLVDWIGERHTPFTEQEVLEAARATAVTISNHSRMRTNTVKRLLHILEKAGYLKNDGMEYQECLNHQNQPLPSTVEVPKNFPPVESVTTEADAFKPSHFTTPPNGSHSAPSITEESHVSSSSVTAFISYSHKDKRLREKFETHLAALRHQGILKTWYDGKILAGDEIDNSIMKQLEAAPIVFLLVSADFLASKYCYGIEMENAIRRHDVGEARVIPIILRECDWEKTPFQKLKALPEDGKPITSKHWKTQDAAFKNVARGIRTVLEQFVAQSPAP